METFNWNVIGKPKERKCWCGKKERLIPYCGYYICVWCRTGLDRVPRSIKVSFRRMKVA